MDLYEAQLRQERINIETRFQTLAQLHAGNSSNYKMLLLGVLFGVIGGLFGTMFYELIIGTLPYNWQGFILVLVTLIFGYFIIDFATQMKGSHDKILEVKKTRDKINSTLDALSRKVEAAKASARNIGTRKTNGSEGK